MFNRTTEYPENGCSLMIASAILLISALILASVCLTDGTMAESEDDAILLEGECGPSITYVLYEDGRLVLTGEGDTYSNIPVYNPDPRTTQWGANYLKITEVEIGEGVTNLGNFLFAGCKNIKEITLPSTLVTIWEGAFYGCSNLESIDLPDSVKTLGKDVFYNCTALKTIEIPASSTSINGNIFAGCTDLMNISVDSKNKSFSTNNGILYTKSGTKLLICPSGLTEATITLRASIANDDAFKGCCNLIRLDTGGLLSINSTMMSDCQALETVSLPNVTTIGNQSFKDMSRIREITMPEVTSIGDYAFAGCCNITSLVLPASLNTIGIHSFQNCYRLAEVGNGSHLEIKKGTIGNGDVALYALRVYDPSNENSHLQYYIDGNGVEYGFLLDDEWYLVYSNGVTGDIVLPSSISIDGTAITEYSVSQYVYSYQNGITSVLVPAIVKDLEGGSFSHCSSLKLITVSCKGAIRNGSFEDCPSLESITIASQVEFIGTNAFPGIVFRDTDGSVIETGSDGLSGHEFIKKDEAFVKKADAEYTLVKEGGVYIVETTGYHITLDSETVSSIISESKAVELTVILNDCKIVLDNATLKGLRKDSTDIGIVIIPYENLTEAEKALVSGPIYRIYLGANTDIKGNITVTVPYVLEKGSSNDHEAVVEVVDGSNRGYIPCVLSDGILTFSTTDVASFGAFVCKGHVPGETVIENVTEPTCTVDGGHDNAVYCTVCYVEISRTHVVDPALGHDSEIIPAVEPTCTETGLTEGKRCSRCGVIFVEQTAIPAMGHDYVGTIIKEPSCKAEGTMQYVCTHNSEHRYTETIAKLDHVPETVPAVEPTCTETGLTEGERCSVCGTTLKAQGIVPAMGHDLVQHDAKVPTASEDGWYAYETCNRCEYSTFKEWKYAGDNTIMIALALVIVLVIGAGIVAYALKKRK